MAELRHIDMWNDKNKNKENTHNNNFKENAIKNLLRQSSR